MSISLEESYSYCRRVARRRARNFYYSFMLLSARQRNGMCALYTFNRVCDDISDEPDRLGYDSPERAIADWREQLEGALHGRYAEHPSWPAFHDTVEGFHIPAEYFRDMIAGVSSDLEPRQIESFDELYRYCYQVASAVGLSVLHVFGFDSDEALPLAEKCGIAFQLTNILRDVREDAQMGRVYLPREDLERFGVEPRMLGRAVEPSREFRQLMQFEAGRAKGYYRDAEPLIQAIHPRSRGSLWALIRTYRRLLERIESSGFDVLRQRIRVPGWEKMAILLRGAVRR